MNAVSINVCIIHYICTNRTSVEPVVLSDVETGLHCCLCFAGTFFKSCFMWAGCTGGTSNSLSTLAFFLARTVADCFWSEWANSCSISHRKGKKNEAETKAGCGVVICASVSLCSLKKKLLFSGLTQSCTFNTRGQGHD